MKELLLSEFKPVSQCVTKETQISKAKFKVIDIHEHMGKMVLSEDYQDQYDLIQYEQELKRLNVRHVVNLDGVWGHEFTEIMHHTEAMKQMITTFVWIDVSKIDEPDFSEQVKTHLTESYAKGARGIKMWKVISLNQKDKAGNYIRKIGRAHV